MGRSRAVRRLSRVILAVGVLVAVFAPISWERLPDFKAVVVPPSAGDPPSKPGPGIDPDTPPPGPKVISPEDPVPAADSGDFRYQDLFGDQPPYVSSCDPIPFEIRTTAAPANGDDLVFGALQRLADVTGLSFEFTAYTSDVYSFNERRTRFSWETDRDPLWIGWATSDEVPDLGPKSDAEAYAIGVGGPVAYQRDDGSWEVLGGGVVLRAGESLPNRFGPGSNTGNVLLHELGHAFGLDHVDSTDELLYPTLLDGAPDGFAPGDRQGLQGLTIACDS